jgi:hypothetical protein
MKPLLIATAAVLSMTAAAGAADAPRPITMLAGGPLIDGNEANIYCEFTNFGSTSITPIAQQLYLTNSTTAISSGASCPNGSPVAPLQGCYIYSTSTFPHFGASCQVTFSGSAVNVRGAVQILNTSYDTLATTELR